MFSYTSDILTLIGNTPMIKLKGESVFGKAEFLNPGGSIKDRVALAMIEQAEISGVLKAGMSIVEPTSGNTGIGITLVGKSKGYDVTIVMPEGMSQERKQIIKALGGRLVLTPDSESVDGAVRRAKEIQKETGAFMPDQFSNPANPAAHYDFTAAEIWRQMAGNIGAFVSGIGSGGTIQGIGRFLKEHNPEIKIIAVEPKHVSALLGYEPGLHQIQGIGDGFIPEVLDVNLIDQIIEVSDDEAFDTARGLALENSMLVGTSAGANVFGARQVLRQYPGINVVTVFPDRAERYFSTSLFRR